MRWCNLGRRLWLRVWPACLAAAFWLPAGPVALAAEQGQPARARDWGFAYVLSLLCIALGLLAVGRPSRRRERDRPEQYGE